MASLFVSAKHTVKPPLKIAVLYYANIDEDLKSELLQNITATYLCTVTEIKCIATLPKAANKVLFNDRFIKVALHELGHTMGLPHCTFSKVCFMEAAEGTIKSVDREKRFLCSNCKKLISHYIR